MILINLKFIKLITNDQRKLKMPIFIEKKIPEFFIKLFESALLTILKKNDK